MEECILNWGAGGGGGGAFQGGAKGGFLVGG